MLLDYISSKRSLGFTSIDSILMFCEEHSIDPEDVAVYIKKDPILRSKIEVEAFKMNMLNKDEIKVDSIEDLFDD